MERGTLKSSTIFIATGGATNVYRSVNDVPPALRKKLAASTNSVNSGTILIADHRGRDEIARLIQALPASAEKQSRFAHWLSAAVALFKRIFFAER